MHSAFKRAAKGILAALGEDALLRGAPAGKVNIENGVQVVGDGDAIAERDVATIESIYSPRIGDTLVHPDGTFKLDQLYQDNGATRRYVVRRI